MNRFILDQDLHLHSKLSACSRDPEQSTERILRRAKDDGISTVCLTDHYWDSALSGASNWYAPQNFDHIAKAKPLPQEAGIRFLFGCETELRRDLKLGIPPERYDDFDFIVIPTTHLHMTGFTISEEDADSLDARAHLWVERLDALLHMELPFHKIGVAHLACPLIAPKSRQDYLAALDRIPTTDMERLFQRAADVGIGIELNAFDMAFSEDEAETVLRTFRIAKQMGCRFYTASDAHHPDDFSKFKPNLERAIELLGLLESDKFHI